MNGETAQQLGQHLAAPASVHTFVLVAAAAAVAGLWVRAHVWKQGVSGRWRSASFALRVAIGLLALQVAALAAQRFVVFATGWPLGVILLGGALAAETVCSSYRLERRAVTPRSAGVLITALRVLLVLLLTAMLCQPVLTFELSRRLDREVAVLVDASGSMRVPDSGMTPGERLRLAEALSLRDARRPYRLDEVERALRADRETLTARGDWLASLAQTDPAGRTRQLGRRSRALREELLGLVDSLVARTNAMLAPVTDAVALDEPSRTALVQLAGRVAAEAISPLAQAAKQSEELGKEGGAGDAAYAKVSEALRAAATALDNIAPRLGAAGDAVDGALYAACPPAGKAAIDAAAARSRLDLAAALLTDVAPTAQGTRESLIEELRKEYRVSLYGFAGKVSRTAPDVFHGADDTNRLTGLGILQTDIAGALNTAAADIPGERLAGILILSDGRDNAGGDVEAAGRTLGLRQAPVCSVIFGGGAHPPRDLAIVSVSAPDTVYTRDRMFVDVNVKVDNLPGTNLVVGLYDGTELVDSRIVNAPTDSFRKRVQLADQPKTNGLHRYRVGIQVCEGEVNVANNTVELPVNVTDDRIRLLVIDGRPRWEFRYLKNLFLGRDVSVQLQYVLFHPDEVLGLPPRPKVAASASRPLDDAEATALPENEAEWMKFDVIVLGDVDPGELGEPAQAALQKFVAERGGTLIVIAGSLHTPHAYGGSPLADLLPVVFTPGDRPVLTGPEPSYRIALTREGQESPILRMAVEPEENRKIWEAAPDIHWRHSLRGTKEGATVLAYAFPTNAPEFLQTRHAHEVPDEEQIRQRASFERENPLLVAHHYALGRVMFFAFDHTWRLRYRTGDTYHHKLWGQVLRWATADKIQYGAAQVRVGTDQSRYEPGVRVRVRSKVVKPDFTPVLDARPVVTVMREGQPVLRRRLQYEPGSAGVYGADIGALPEGVYRAELDEATVRSAEAGAAPGAVAAEFAVTGAIAGEMIELAADRGLLGRLAGLTGGRVIDPGRIREARAEFKAPTLVRRERRQHELWDSWALLVAAVVVAGAEWLLRKKARLP